MASVGGAPSSSKGGGVRRKRRENQAVCVTNSLFIKWVEELRDDAKERGLKSHYSYTRAINSLKKYPLPLSSGEEAKILDHVGNKLAKILDKRLAEYHADEGTSSSITKAPPITTPTAKKVKTKARKGSSSGIPTKKRIRDEEESGGSLPSPEAKKKKQSAREYIPGFRSGPYALIIALRNAKEKPSWRGYLKKAQLIADAQPLCDVSFTIPDPGSYYTAWSSMSSVIRKGLIQKFSNPAKFSLTDIGEDMALKLLQGSLTRNKNAACNSPKGSIEPFTASTAHEPTGGRDVISLDSSSPESSVSVKNQGLSPKEVSFTAQSQSMINFVDSPPSSIPSDLSDSDGERTEIITMTRPDLSTVESRTSPSPHYLSFWYVDHSGKTVLGKDKAAVTFNDIVSVGFLIKCDRGELEAASVPHTIDECRRGEGNFVYAYLNNLHAPDVANPPPSPDLTIEHEVSRIPETPLGFSPVKGTKKLKPRHSSRSSSSNIMSNTTNSALANLSFGASTKTSPSGPLADVIVLSDSDDDDDDEKDLPPLNMRLTASTSSEKSGIGLLEGTATNVSCMDKMDRNSLTPSRLAGLAAIKRTAKRLGDISVHEPINDSRIGGERNALLTCTSSSSPTSSSTLNVQSSSSSVVDLRAPIVESNICKSSGLGREVVNLGDPEFVLTPGNFDIVLIVDSSESTASRKSSSQFRGILLQELGKNGVMFDVRKLNVGDFTWIAREKVIPKPGILVLPESKEAVLEYIVERKRMDDLAGSIIDGRFNEQKFRMKNSGILHPVYLVEEHGDPTHFKMDRRTLNQAVANTQIIDGFFIKRTGDIRESVAYLTVMTRSFQMLYAGKTIKAYSWDVIADHNKDRSLQRNLTADIVHAMEFSKFNEASIKNKILTVREMFGKHLIQISGISAEKASVILGKYPTLVHLIEAYSGCDSEEEKKKLIENLRSGANKRRLGRATSLLLYSLYSKGQPV